MRTKWVHRRSSPWILLAIVSGTGILGMLILAAITAALGNTETTSPMMIFSAIWMLAFGLGIPAMLIAAIVWSIALRPTADPALRQARAEHKLARTASATDRKTRRRELRAEMRTQRRNHRHEAATQRRAIKADTASRKAASRQSAREDKQAKRAAAAQRATRQREQRAAQVATKPREPEKRRAGNLEPVLVAFCKNGTTPSPWKTYTYLWPYESKPEVGKYVIVKGNGEDSLAQIMALGDGGYVGASRIVKRVATAEDLRTGGSRVRFQ